MTLTKIAVSKRERELRANAAKRAEIDRKAKKLADDLIIRKRAEADVRARELQALEAKADRAEAQTRASDPVVRVQYRGLLLAVKDTAHRSAVVRQQAMHALGLALHRINLHNTKVVTATRNAAKGITGETPMSREILARIIQDDARHAIANGSFTITVLD